MKRLILVRHAKSSWSDANMSDKERPLDDRGQAAAPQIGRWLATHGYQPDEVLCSTARRCRETWDGLKGELNPVANLRFEDLLYLASDEDMLATLRTAEGDTVMMVGHMPGIGSLAADLRQDPPPLHGLFQKYPTGAVTVLDFATNDWAEADLGTGQFVDFITPKEL